MLKTSPKDIPTEWTLRPNFSTRPIQRHRAILWLIAHLVYYQTQRDTQNAQQDYADFLRRARWKAQTEDKQKKKNMGTIYKRYRQTYQ